jgi:hypothetical protein
MHCLSCQGAVCGKNFHLKFPIDFFDQNFEKLGTMKNENTNMNSLTSNSAIQLAHDTVIAINEPDVVAQEAADEAEWQEQYDRDKAISTICSLYPPGCGASLEYDRISSETLYQAVCDNSWESLPTAILVRLAELQVSEDERLIYKALTNR